MSIRGPQKVSANKVPSWGISSLIATKLGWDIWATAVQHWWMLYSWHTTHPEITLFLTTAAIGGRTCRCICSWSQNLVLRSWLSNAGCWKHQGTLSWAGSGYASRRQCKWRTGQANCLHCPFIFLESILFESKQGTHNQHTFFFKIKLPRQKWLRRALFIYGARTMHSWVGWDKAQSIPTSSLCCQILVTSFPPRRIKHTGWKLGFGAIPIPERRLW